MFNHCLQDVNDQAKVNAANYEAMYLTKDYVVFKKKTEELDFFKISPQDSELGHLKVEFQKLHIDCVKV